MFKKSCLTLLFAALSLLAQNLILDGDFSNSNERLVPECRSNGGQISLHTEDLTWNKCARLSIDKINKDAEGNDQISVAMWIGGGKNNLDNAGPGGFACKPDTTYQFSLDIRGTANRLGVSAIEWQSKDKLWNFKRNKTTLGGIQVQPEWTNYKGSFTTGPQANNAALYVQIWWNAKHGPTTMKVGDYVLVDNVSILEQKNNPLSADNETGKTATLKLRKSIATKTGIFSDFAVFKSDEEPGAKTQVQVGYDEKAITLNINCEEPMGVMPAEKGLWSGDVIEIFFGDKLGDRRLSQFVFGPDGGKYSGLGDRADDSMDWQVEVQSQTNAWQAKINIPFETLGWKNPQEGDSIAFNVARQRKKANEMISWAELKLSFHDVEHFGKLILGDYPGGMNREQYERSEAEKEQARLQEKLDKFAQRTYLLAPVRITEDFSLPFLPDAMFDPPEKIELRAAINELKPLALALGNLKDKAVEYRIQVELQPEKDELRFDWHNGRPFPAVTLRHAIPMRDSGNSEDALLDPLPRMNEANSMMVPPKEAGLLWLDFDCSQLEAGTYNGRIRVIPLNDKGIFNKAGYGYGNLDYEGEMSELPFSLKIDPIVLDTEPSVPGNFFSPPANKQVMQLLEASGMRIYLLNPWSLKFPDAPNGGMEPVAANATRNLQIFDDLNQQKLLIGYSCFSVFMQQYKNKAERWPEWLQALGAFIKNNGLQPQNCYVEIYDEPNPKDFQEIFKVMQEARENLPGVKLTLTLGAHIMSAEQMELLDPYVDCWTLWSHGYFKQPEHLAFIRKAQQEGREVWHYTCDTALRSSLDRNYRRNAWFGEYHRLDGNSLYQGITGLVHCMWKKTPAGEILYHGPDWAIPSIRYMAFRQGMTDIKYLHKLRQIAPDNPEVQEFLRQAAKRVVVDFGHDPETPDKVREEAADLILKLQQTK